MCQKKFEKLKKKVVKFVWLLLLTVTVQRWHELSLLCAVDDHVSKPPLFQHAVVGRRFVAVAREDHGDGSASAEADSGVEVRENWCGHGREIVLHVDDQQYT